MIKHTISGNGISFSKIFNDKKSIALYFPKDFGMNYEIVKETIRWTPCFQTMLLVLPEYQRNFFNALIDEPSVNIEALEEHSPSGKDNLVLILSRNKQTQKKAEGNSSSATFGFGKSVNVRFNPPVESPLELCRNMAELLQIKPSKEAKGKKFPGTPQELFDNVFQERKFVFDINNPITRIGIRLLMKKYSSPYEYLFVKTKFPKSKSHLVKLLPETKSPKHYPLRYDLYEIVKHCNQSKIVITDNKSFFDLLTNFPLQNRLLFCKGLFLNHKVSDYLK
ncbi:MAG: hypothetical protein K0B81_01320 [Candidatus Cloacimonetes bacterium]|nr:hypothetical protein [Candidatus Cloacimonadota bacterium]